MVSWGGAVCSAVFQGLLWSRIGGINLAILLFSLRTGLAGSGDVNYKTQIHETDRKDKVKYLLLMI